MYLCVLLRVCVCKVYLFLASTQWRENQTKDLEPSDKKTILQFLTAMQTTKLFVCNRENKKEKKEKRKESK